VFICAGGTRETKGTTSPFATWNEAINVKCPYSLNANFRKYPAN